MTLGDQLMDAHDQNLRVNEGERIERQHALNQLADKTGEMLESVFLHHLSRQEVAKRIGLRPLTVSRGTTKGIDGLDGLTELLQNSGKILPEMS